MTDQRTLLSQQNTESSQPSDEVWRKEIHARVAGYRSRRGRRVEGAFSMRFPFPAAELAGSASVSEEACETDGMEEPQIAMPQAAAAECSVELAPQLAALIPELSGANVPAAANAQPPAASEPEQADAAPMAPGIELEPDPTPRPPLTPRPRTRRKVIAFPRPAIEATDSFRRLADPVLPDQPRILDVPEELEAFPTTTLLDGLRLPASGQQPATAADHIDLPFQAVAISQRLYAGVIDCALIAVGSAIFAAVAYKMLPQVELSKPLLLTLAAVSVLMWAIYQYIFTLYGGATAGMRMAGIRLRTFKGAPPDWRHRRSRVIGLYFSSASLMMGLLWGLVDVDGLCWHDRISRTYLTTRK